MAGLMVVPSNVSVDISLDVKNGKYSNINYNISLSRMDLNSAMFPSEGSEISLSLQMTPPYSLFNGKTYSDI